MSRNALRGILVILTPFMKLFARKGPSLNALPGIIVIRTRWTVSHGRCGLSSRNTLPDIFVILI